MSPLETLKQALEYVKQTSPFYMLTEPKPMAHELISALTTAIEEMEKLKTDLAECQKDAARWLYTQRENYFMICDMDSYHYRYRVGIQPPKKSVNSSVTGMGKTLAEAIDAALEKEHD